jgi:chromosome segregation ATPase
MSIQSSQYQQSSLGKDQTIQKITSERNDLRTEVAALESQLSQFNELKEWNVQMSEDVERATIEQMNLCEQVENLTRNLDLESERSSKFQSQVLDIRAHCDELETEVAELQLHLDIE